MQKIRQKNNTQACERERHKIALSIIEMCIFALLGALLFAQKLALRTLPNIHLCAVIIIASTVCFGWKALYSVVVFVLLDMCLYGFGTWTIGYFVVWPALVAVSMAFRRERSPWVWALIAAVHGLLFDIPFAFINLFVGGKGLFFSYLFSGLIFDVIHCVSNYAITLLLFAPLCRVMTLGMNAVGLKAPSSVQEEQKKKL